jgi:DNA-binding XRE family transcriptional regulator
MNIEVRIKYWIEMRGYKNKYVAKQLGVSDNTVSNWITGRAYPPIPKAFELAELLEVTVNDLYCIKKDPAE